VRAQLEATRQIIAADEESLRILRDQFRLGFAMRVDVAAQETALAQARATLPPLQLQFEQTRDLLRALVAICRTKRWPKPSSSMRCSCRRSCRSPCPRSSSNNGPMSGRPRHNCTPPMQRSASRSPRCCRSCRSQARMRQCRPIRLDVPQGRPVLEPGRRRHQPLFEAVRCCIESAPPTTHSSRLRAISEHCHHRLPERCRYVARVPLRRRHAGGRRTGGERGEGDLRPHATADGNRLCRISHLAERADRLPAGAAQSRAGPGGPLRRHVALFQALGGGWWNHSASLSTASR